MKRGQVTIFAVLGFVVVILVLYALSTANEFNSARDYALKQNYFLYDYNGGLIQNTVQNCISASQDFAIRSLASNAGYLSIPVDNSYGEYNNPPTHAGAVVLLRENDPDLLSKDVFAKKICQRVYVDLQSCISKQEFEDAGFFINTSVFNGDFANLDSYCNATLRKESVLTSLSYSVQLEKDGVFFSTNDFNVESPYALSLMHDSVSRFLDEVEDRDYLENLTYDVSTKCDRYNGYDIEIDDRIVVFKDKLAQLKGLPDLTFRFAVLDYNITGSCN